MAAPSGTRRVPKARNTVSSAVAQYNTNQALNSAANKAAPSGTRRVPKGKSSGTQACPCPCRAKGKSSGTQAVSTGKSKGKSSGTEAVSTGPSKGKSRRLLMAAPSGTRRVPKARNTVSSAVAQYNTNQALNSAANKAAPSGTRRVPKGKSSGTQAVSTGRSKGKSSGTQAVSTGPSKGKSRR